MILTSNETTVDMLNNEAIATPIIGLLREKPEGPGETIGVHGDWGAGKSSLLEMMKAKRQSNNKLADVAVVVEALGRLH